MEDGDRVGHERRLRAAVLQGDESAWREWYQAAAPGLRAYVHWRCPGLPDLADEVVQETWLTAIRRARTFRPETGSFVGWLRGIAANLIRNRVRKKCLHPSLSSTEETNLRCRPASDGPSETVAIALAALPPHYEEVLRAKYLDELSVQAVADRLGQSPKAVESLLTRARQEFREAYQAVERNDG